MERTNFHHVREAKEKHIQKYENRGQFQSDLIPIITVGIV